MRRFNSVAEVDAAGLPEPTHSLVRRVMVSLVDAFGGPEEFDGVDNYLVLVEEADEEAANGREVLRREIAYDLASAPWEGVVREDGFFHAAIMFTNSGGPSVLVPDAPWLSDAARRNLLANMDGERADG